MDMVGGRKERVEYMESNMETYIIICKIDSKWEFAVWLKEFKLGLCNNLERWGGDGGRRQVQEGGDIWLIHVDVCQKPTQCYKAVIPQLKINKR